MKIVMIKILAVALVLSSLWGCVQTRPVPGYARAGDVVVLGLGGVQRNWSGFKAEDLTITITDSDNDTYDLNGLSIFKSYPDHMAFMNVSAIDGNDQGLDLVPFDGGWFVMVSLRDGALPLPLATGQATISISAPNLINTAKPFEGDLTSIGIEILAGETSVDNAYTQQFVGYAQTPINFLIRPQDLNGVDTVAGAFFKIDYYDDSFFRDGIEPVIVPSSHNPYVQLAYNVVSNGNGTGSINITLLNPAGFKTVATADTNSSLLADLSLNMVYFADGPGAQAAIANAQFDLDTSSSYYIDDSGAIIEGLSPTFTHSSEL